MGMPKIRPHGIETPDLIETKFDTVDYICEMMRSAKFHANWSTGVSRQMGEIYAKSIIYIYLFSTHLQVRHLGGLVDFS